VVLGLDIDLLPPLHRELGLRPGPRHKVGVRPSAVKATALEAVSKPVGEGLGIAPPNISG
jgi:hypothetical protein